MMQPTIKCLLQMFLFFVHELVNHPLQHPFSARLPFFAPTLFLLFPYATHPPLLRQRVITVMKYNREEEEMCKAQPIRL